MLTIQDYEVYNLDNALISAGLPMRVSEDDELTADIKRGAALGGVKVGTGHDCYLKGIMVYMVIKAPLPFWGQWERYAFQDTISSTSQMHKLKDYELDYDDFAPETPAASIDILKECQEIYEYDPTDENFRKMSFAVPQGFLYARAVTTNYLQLKTMLRQRRHHKTREWQQMCDFIEELPMFDVLVNKAPFTEIEEIEEYPNIEKEVLIVNGFPCSGKTLFSKILSTYVGVETKSSIDLVKKVAVEVFNRDEEKNEENRVFLSNLKATLIRHTTVIEDDLDKAYNDFIESDNQILTIDIREPKEIEYYKDRYNAKTVLIKRTMFEKDYGNYSDNAVMETDYDYEVENYGSKEDFENEIKKLLDKINGDQA